MITTYTVTIEKDLGNKNETLEDSFFNDKKTANKFIKEMIKKYNLKKHAGHIVNYSDQIELFTNY